jgi:hypothetical protein
MIVTCFSRENIPNRHWLKRALIDHCPRSGSGRSCPPSAHKKAPRVGPDHAGPGPAPEGADPKLQLYLLKSLVRRSRFRT